MQRFWWWEPETTWMQPSVLKKLRHALVALPNTKRIFLDVQRDYCACKSCHLRFPEQWLSLSSFGGSRP